MDKTMGILRAPLWCVLAAVGLSMASLMEYIPLEGRLEIPLKSNSNITTVALWKQLPSGQTLVAEWDWSTPAKDKVYDGTYEGRTELDKETRVIVIRNMTKEDNGKYYIVVNQNSEDKPYNVMVIKNVTKPSVVYRPPCVPQSTTCSLVCEGNITDSGPVTYRWYKDEGEWMESGQNWTITNDEEWKKVKKVFCEMKNPISEEQSDPCDNPLYINVTLIVGIIVAIILTFLLGVGVTVKYFDRIKGMYAGSEPVDVPEEDASSPRNENEGRPLLENNHDSTNDSIVPIATSLYVLCEQVRGNKKQCQRLVKRVKDLVELVGEIKLKGAGQNSDDVEKALCDLKETLESAKDVVKKYISDSFHEHVFKDYNDNSEFRSLNSSLNSALNKLSKALQVDHILSKLSKEDSQQPEDEADRKKDHAELKRIMDLIDPIMDKAASLSPLREGAMRNKERRQCLVERVEVLEERLGAIKLKGPGQNYADVEEALCELKTTLESEEVAAFVEKYTSDWKCTDYSNDFDSLNKCLCNALNKLSSALPFDQNHKLFE